jgi:hypothetical protein
LAKSWPHNKQESQGDVFQFYPNEMHFNLHAPTLPIRAAIWLNCFSFDFFSPDHIYDLLHLHSFPHIQPITGENKTHNFPPTNGFIAQR